MNVKWFIRKWFIIRELKNSIIIIFKWIGIRRSICIFSTARNDNNKRKYYVFKNIHLGEINDYI